MECYKSKYDECKNDLVLAEATLETIAQILDGVEPSDFMLSFPLVRKVWDKVNENIPTG